MFTGVRGVPTEVTVEEEPALLVTVNGQFCAVSLQRIAVVAVLNELEHELRHMVARESFRALPDGIQLECDRRAIHGV